MNKIKNNITWFTRIINENINNEINNSICIDFDESNDITIMSFNIRRDAVKDKMNNWQYRKEAIVQMICDVKPDIICMQEVMPHMAKYLKSQLCKYYDCCGLECFTGQELTKSLCVVGEGLLTLYRKDRFLLKSSNKIKLFDGRKINVRRAFCTKLWDCYTQHSLSVINTHFCHKSNDARYKSFQKLKSHYQNDDSFLYFVCGDFNCQINQFESGIQIFKDLFTYNKPDSEGTINYFSNASGKTIDFIFSNHAISDNYVLRTSYNNRKFLSDHWPIINIYKTV